MNKYGIDYGTTNSSIAISYMDNGSAQTSVIEIEDTMPKVVMPSKVLVTETGYKAGRNEAQSSNVHMIVRKPKDYLAPKKDYQTSESEKALPPQEVIRINGKDHETVRLIAAVLEKLRIKAQFKARELGVTPSGVVMGVPVEYGEAQKRVLKEALVEAGFYRNYDEADSRTEFVSEPVAVAVDYGLKITENMNVLVFDFGGGTLDIAVMNLKNDVSKQNRDHLHPHTVIVKEGADLGGELITKAFFVNSFIGPGKYTMHEFARAFGIPSGKDPLDMWNSIMALGKEGDRFFEAVDRLKCSLSTMEKKSFDYTAPRGSLKQVSFTRQDFSHSLEKPFDGSSESVIDRIESLIRKVLDNPKIGGNSGIDTVIVAGGSSMIPRVKELLYDIFPGQLHEKVGPTEALTSIVRGLSLVGCREDSILDDVVDNDYGFWDVGRRQFCPVVLRGTKVADTLFDKAKHSGKFVPFRNNDPASRQMDVRIMQRNKYGEADLGTISLFGTDDRIYRLYMNVDKKQGILRCFVFDTKDKVWLDDTGDVSKYECQYKLK